jgi:hypothetical protein
MRGAAWLLVLFSLPFTGVGVFMGWLIFSTVVEWRAAAHWVETPAYILETRLESHEDSEGATTYQATARYRYVFDDRNYEGERVSLFSGSDNLGDFHQRVYAELSRYAGSDGPFRCYVDPANPAQAILYRELRWGMLAFMALFGAIFGGAGLAILVSGLAAEAEDPAGTKGRVLRGKAPAALPTAPRRPKATGQGRPAWRSGRIPAGGRAATVVLTLFTLFWLLVTSPVLFMLREEVVERENYAALLALLFPLLGLVLLAVAIYKILHWRKYGNVLLLLDAIPGRIGGELRGHIEIPAPLESPRGVKLRLCCLRVITRGSGKGRSTHEAALWEETQTALQRVGRERGRTEVPVRFHIPDDAPPSDDSDPRDKTLWRLEASAEVPGVDLGVEFEVPVLRKGE